MNLVAYDNLDTNINTKKTWINVSKKLLLSREIKCRKFVTFGKRFDADENKTILFIIVLNDPPSDRSYSKLILDDSGRCKISLKNVWNEIGLDKIKTDINISIKHTQSADDGDVYEILI